MSLLLVNLFWTTGAEVTVTWPPLVGIVKATVTIPAEVAAVCNTSAPPGCPAAAVVVVVAEVMLPSTPSKRGGVWRVSLSEDWESSSYVI